MEVLPIGSITIFTNISERQQYLFDADLNQKISDALANRVKIDVEKKFQDSVVIISYETRIGCIITPILIGIVVKTAAAAGTGASVGTGLTLIGAGGVTYKFVTGYDKIKKNMKTITDDLKVFG